MVMISRFSANSFPDLLKTSSNKKAPTSIYRTGLWNHLESNQGHTDFQSVALPTELWLHLFQAIANVRKNIFSQNFYVEFLFI